MAATAAKTERLVARVSVEQKQAIEHAAALTGLSLTDFILAAVQRAASEAVREHRVLVLSAHDSRMFAEAVLGDREPGEALLKSARRAPARIAWGEGLDVE
jgi:uncharacterized protein (DUF1778 family)